MLCSAQGWYEQGFIRRVVVWICSLSMIMLAVIALFWWGAAWVTLLVLALVAGCLSTVIYAWISEKQFDKKLNSIIRGVNEKYK